MKKYDKWYVTRNDKVIWCGTRSKLLEKYKLTNEQFIELLKNQQFPWGDITKKIDYCDFSIPEDFSFSGWNGSTYFRCLCKNALIGMLENNEYLDASVDSVMNNEFDTPNMRLIEKMARIAFGFEKIVIKINEHPYSKMSNIISIRLPMKQYPSCCFEISKYYLVKNEKNSGYNLIKIIFKEIQRLRNKPSYYVGKTIYVGTKYIRPASEPFNFEFFKPSYYYANTDINERRSDFIDQLNIMS